MNAKRKPPSGKPKRPGFPSQDDILKFLRDNNDEPGKREIARAFNIRGQDRIALKKLLKSMTEQGLLKRHGKKVREAGSLAPVTVLIITGIDEDGEVLARPAEWDEDSDGQPPQIVVRSDRAGSRRRDQQTPGIGQKILAKTRRIKGSDYPYEASTIRVLASSSSQVLGMYRRDGDMRRVVPVDKRARSELTVQPGDDGGAQSGELVEVELVRDRGRDMKSARVVKRLGSVSDQRNISLIAIHQHDIPNAFSQDVLKETKELAPYAHSGRTDLRDVPLITIDPPDARDHDDAVWAAQDDAPDNAGGFQVIVAIADVAHYVNPSSALDRDARTRGNSVYFPDLVVPMLPERISNDLCSLKEHQDRPALACFMTFSKSGAKKSHRFERVTMCSHASLSYEQAQAAIDGHADSTAGPLTDVVLRPLWKAFGKLSSARSRRAPLELELPERKIILNDEGFIDRILTPDRLDAHRLVEEFMIQANIAAAETLEKARTPLLYRVHEAPGAEKVQALHEFLSSLGLSSPKGQVMQPKNFNALLQKVKGKDYQQIVHDVVLRTQSQAVYSPNNQGHFGLNLRRYAHFTSPIRRYADLIVHRALISALNMGNDGLSDTDMANLDDTAEFISGAERRAMVAERDTVDRLVAAYLADRLRARFTGRISGVNKAGLFIRLDDTGADGFVPVSTIGSDYFVHEEVQHALVGAQTGETYQLADRVEVRLVEVTPIAGGLRFELLSTGKPGKRPKQIKRRERRPGSRRRRS